MMRRNLKRHRTLWQGCMIIHNVLCGNLDETRKQSMAPKQHTNHFAVLLDIAKQQNPDVCRISTSCCRAQQVDELSQDDIKDILQQLVLVTIVTEKGGVPDIRALRDVTNGHGLVALFQRQCDQGPGQQMLCSSNPPVPDLHSHLQYP